MSFGRELVLAALALGLVGSAAWAEAGKPAGLPNAFYAMDTAFVRPGLTQDQQFALVKELGYAGIGWHDEAPEQAKANAEAMAKAGLKMTAIYCGATVTPAGELTHSPKLPDLMAALKGHETIIWMHIGGKGPAMDALTGQEPLVKTLRQVADTAAANGLCVAIYPHVGEWTAKFADAVRLAKVVKHPQFGVSLNLCHALAMGEEKALPTLIEEAKGLLVTATICGADAGVTGADWGRLIQTLDKGTYDVAGLLRRLRKVGFTGPVGFQGYGIQGDARPILAPTMAAWRKLSSAAAADE
ncbi:MAG TPA: TIM barrel protein [Phycisphaerae bacterium]|nr:TIM barrel protein [Phycisphaerae bacterium]